MDHVAALSVADEFAVAGLGSAAGSPVSLSTLHPGVTAVVHSVGQRGAALSALERRLLELGFIHGEQVEVLSEARPGRDPFVVRVGTTTLALRRREAQTIWVDPPQL